MRRLAVLLLLLPLLAGTLPAHETAELQGTLQLVQDGKPVREGVDQAVVYFTPAEPGKADKVTPLALPLEMATYKKEFKPRALVLPLGSMVRFPNQDPIPHNAFSVSGGNAFDVGLYGKGAGKTVTFKEPGLVRVFCNVHQQMAAYVLVHAVDGLMHQAILSPPPGLPLEAIADEAAELVLRYLLPPEPARPRLRPRRRASS